MANDERTIAAWTAYWRTGRGASCFHGADVEMSLARNWEQFADALPDGARLLDLATGNGTVARLCAARARARNVRLHIDAVDAAEIDPPKAMPDPAGLFAGMRFHGGVRLEALPFPDASFDAAVSQFGFEYANAEAAAGEIARVLAGAGRLRLVMHAKDGAVARDIGQRLERLRAVLAPQGAVTLVRTLARALDAGDGATIARESAHLPAATETVRAFTRAHVPADDSALFYASEFLRSWALRDRTWPAELRRSVEDGWANADGVFQRQAEMLRVARSREDMAALVSLFAARDVSTSPAQEIRDEQRGLQIAWLLDARKAPAPGS